jgi:hypothetical protein
MDKILESLRQVYADMDEEQRILRIIEDILLVPSTLKEATPDEEPEILDNQPVDAAPEPDAEPVEPSEPPEPKPAVAPEPEPAATPDALPDIQKSQVKTPTPKLTQPKIPVAQPKPEQPKKQPQEQPPKLPKTAGKTQSIQPTDDVNAVMKKLQSYRKRGMIFRSPLKSTALSYMAYNPRTRGLNVTFSKNGRTYHYKGVGMDKAAQLFASNSKGKFYNADIKPVHMPAREVT